MTITVTGGVTFSPATVGGGAVSFNGTSQNLTVPATFTNATSTTPFTWEVWVYPTANHNGAAIFTNTYSGSGGVIPFALGGIKDDSTLNFGYYNGSAWVTTNSGVTLTLNTWSHVAAVFSGTVLTLYVNGVSIATLTTSWTTTAGTSPFLIGRRWDPSFVPFYSGYITNLRYVAGTALYTSNFTPPTSPLTITQSANINGNPSAAITGTKTALLLDSLSSSAYLTDSSTNNFTVTPVGSPTFTSSSPITINFINGGAVSFNGTSQYLTIPSTAAFSFGTGDFTIEAWVYTTTDPIPYNNLFDKTVFGGFSASSPSFFCFLTNNSNCPALWNGTIQYGTSPPLAVPTNTWAHVAWVRSSSTLTIYVNGVAGLTVASYTSNFATAGTWYIGKSDTTPDHYFPGYITNLRVVKGIAVYTSNFTPPTNPVTTTQSANVNGNPSAAITGTQTSLLLDALSSSAYLTDSSTNNFTVTPVNSPTFTSSSPFGTGYITFSP